MFLVNYVQWTTKIKANAQFSFKWLNTWKAFMRLIKVLYKWAWTYKISLMSLSFYLFMLPFLASCLSFLYLFSSSTLWVVFIWITSKNRKSTELWIIDVILTDTRESRATHKYRGIKEQMAPVLEKWTINKSFKMCKTRMRLHSNELTNNTH